MKTRRITEIILASSVATLMLATGAAAQQHYSRYENRLADRSQALQSLPAAERAPAVSWYERKTGHSADSTDAGASAIVAPATRLHRGAPSCTATLATRPQRPWCG